MKTLSIPVLVALCASPVLAADKPVAAPTSQAAALSEYFEHQVSAIEGQLYDVEGDMGARERALEIYFKSRPRDAVKLDAAAGHPFLTLLTHAQVQSEAAELLARWDAYDIVLAQPSLRAELQRKHQTTDALGLKQAMLFEAVDSKPLLKAWEAIEQQIAGFDRKVMHAVACEKPKLLSLESSPFILHRM